MADPKQVQMAERPTYAAIASVADGVKENRRTLIMALFFVGAMTAATFGVVIAGNELTKDTKVSGDGALVTINNDPVAVHVSKAWYVVGKNDPCHPEMIGSSLMMTGDLVSQITACSPDSFTTTSGEVSRVDTEEITVFGDFAKLNLKKPEQVVLGSGSDKNWDKHCGCITKGCRFQMWPETDKPCICGGRNYSKCKAGECTRGASACKPAKME